MRQLRYCVAHTLTGRYKAWRNMELNCLIDSELLSFNQSFDDTYIEMLFLLESDQKVKLFVSNKQGKAITVRFKGMQLSARKTTLNDIPTLGEVEGASYLQGSLSLEGDFGLIEVDGQDIILEPTL
ncbi:TPA: hypothetical protein ACN30P_004815 [Vibrio parahaemolyticus]